MANILQSFSSQHHRPSLQRPTVAATEPEQLVQPDFVTIGEPTCSPQQRERLSILASTIFTSAACLSLAEVTSAIQQRTSVTKERATNGLRLMIAEQIVQQTQAGHYHLSESVPF